MLKKETIDKIKALGLDAEKLISAIKATGEVDLELPEGKIFIDETLLTRDSSMKEEGLKEGQKLGFKEGKDKGIEIQGQILLKKFGIDVTTVKSADPDKVAEAIHGVASKGDAGLKEQVQQLLAEKETYTRNFEAKEAEIKAQIFNNNLLANMPLKRNTKLFNDTEYLLTTKNNLEFEEVDGAIYPKEKGGDYLRHPDTKAKLPLKEGLEAYFSKRSWIDTVAQQPEGGRGAGDNLPAGNIGGVRKFSEFQNKWEKENPGKLISQPEGMAALKAAADAAGKGNFDYNA